MLRRSALLTTLFVLAVVLSLGVVSGTDGSSRFGDVAGVPGATIRDGLTVAPGTRLVSPAMPGSPSHLPGDRRGRSWTALLDVQLDGKSALNAYVGQARAAGFRQQTRATCAKIKGLGGVRCGASVLRNESEVGQLLTVDVIVCKRCQVPVSALRLRLIEDPAFLVADLAKQPMARPAPESAPTAELSAAERAEATESVRRSNDTGRVKPPERGVIVNGSELVAPVVEFGACQGDWTAVYRVSGDADAVLASYLDSLDSIYGYATRRVTSNRDGARAVRSFYDGGPGTVEVVLVGAESGRSAYLWAENCSD